VGRESDNQPLSHRLILAAVAWVIAAAVVFGLAVAAAHASSEQLDGCDHGATGAECRPDPQPTNGKDCEEHGNQGGINEDHCATTPSPTPSPTCWFPEGCASSTPTPTASATSTPTDPPTASPDPTPTQGVDSDARRIFPLARTGASDTIALLVVIGFGLIAAGVLLREYKRR
jgi:hypothetical protein